MQLRVFLLNVSEEPFLPLFPINFCET
jgi:hypothetical protein